MKRINVLLPTDFSELSWKAMCFAANLNHNRSCNYFIINTTDIPFHQIESNVMVDMTAEIKGSEARMADYLKLFEDLDHHSTSTFELVAHLGTLYGSINNLIETFDEKDESYIFMSTKGANDLSDILFGSITSNIASNIHLPIYCIPENAALENPKNIMLAVDSKILREVEVLTTVAELAKNFGSFVHVVNVSNESSLFSHDSPERFVIDDYLADVKHSFLTIKGSFVQDELILYAEQHHVDLIVMIKRKKGFWQNLFEKSNTKNMSLYGNKPLLILKE